MESIIATSGDNSFHESEDWALNTFEYNNIGTEKNVIEEFEEKKYDSEMHENSTMLPNVVANCCKGTEEIGTSFKILTPCTKHSDKYHSEITWLAVLNLLGDTFQKQFQTHIDALSSFNRRQLQKTFRSPAACVMIAVAVAIFIMWLTFLCGIVLIMLWPMGLVMAATLWLNLQTLDLSLDQIDRQQWHVWIRRYALQVCLSVVLYVAGPLFIVQHAYKSKYVQSITSTGYLQMLVPIFLTITAPYWLLWWILLFPAFTIALLIFEVLAACIFAACVEPMMASKIITSML